MLDFDWLLLEWVGGSKIDKRTFRATSIAADTSHRMSDKPSHKMKLMSGNIKPGHPLLFYHDSA